MNFKGVGAEFICTVTVLMYCYLVPDPAGQEGEGASVLPDRRAGDAEEEGVCHAGELSLVKLSRYWPLIGKSSLGLSSVYGLI